MSRQQTELKNWLDENGCFVPMHETWEEHKGQVDLTPAEWDRLKADGFLGDMDCKWAIARVFRVYAMWRMSAPGAPAMILCRQSDNRVRVWLNPERGFDYDLKWWLQSFQDATRYARHGED